MGRGMTTPLIPLTPWRHSFPWMFILMHRIFLVSTHAASWEPCSFIHKFPVKGHSCFQLYDLLTYWYGRVIFPSFQCWDWDRCSSRQLWLPPFSSRFVVLLWSPLRCVCCGLLYILGTGVCSFSRTGIYSVWSHTARRGATYRLSFTFFHRVEFGVFSICILGSSASFHYAHVGRLHFLPQYGLCKFFPSGFNCAEQAVVPHVCWLCMLLRFGAVADCLESFWPW